MPPRSTPDDHKAKAAWERRNGIEETTEHVKPSVEATNDQPRTAAPMPLATEPNQSLNTHQVPSQLGRLEQCHVPVNPSKDGAVEQLREMPTDGDTEEQTKMPTCPPRRIYLFSHYRMGWKQW